MSTLSISFWRQDLNWYIQQQSWTQSFHQADQTWNDKLSISNSRDPAIAGAETNLSAGSASIAEQKIVTLVNTQTESSLTSALRASSAAGGSLLNLVA